MQEECYRTLTSEELGRALERATRERDTAFYSLEAAEATCAALRSVIHEREELGCERSRTRAAARIIEYVDSQG